MANKNTRPYQKKKHQSGKGRNRNYAISKKLENTMRIRIDLDRIQDDKSLDTSFLEGRKHQSTSKTPKKTEKPVQNKSLPVSKKKDLSKGSKLGKKKSSQDSKFIILLIILGMIAIVVTLFYREFFQKTNKKEEPISIPEEVILDDNYLFVGDQKTQLFPFEELGLDYHYVKIGEDALTTNTVLQNLHDYIYQYNPSDVILQIGFYDLLEGEDISNVIERVERIVIGIHQNRKYSDVYIQSLYPINPEMKNFHTRKYANITSDILEEYNQELEKLSKKLEVTYLDTYSILSEDSLLKEEYTNNGFDLNQEAYQEVLSMIQKEIVSKK